MTEEDTQKPVRKPIGRIRRSFLFLWLLAQYIFDRFTVVAGQNARIIFREKDLFLGFALFLTGLLSFESDKYCDGNTADYLSCTRPSTYYYFGTFDIFLVIIGVFFVLLWFFKSRRAE